MNEVANGQQLAVIEQKRKTWGEFGVGLHKNEIILQALAQQTIKKIAKLPTKIEEVPEAEMALKEAKSDQRRIQDDRKKMTSKLDALVERLMLPEKSIDPPIATLEAEIIKIKRAAADDQAKVKIKADEVKRITEEVVLYVADMHASYLTKMAELLAKSYAHALDNTPPEKLDDYKKQVMARVTEAGYTMPIPVIRSSILTQPELDTIVNQSMNPLNGMEYVQSFEIDLSNRFSDYEIAWKNKEQAKLNAQKEDAENKAAIDSTKQSTTIAARFASSAENLGEPTAATKDLKEAHEVDMPETFESAVTILAAFIANKDKCMPKVKIDKWFNFNANSAGKALAKVKNDDNKFAPSGIKFKKIDKL